MREQSPRRSITFRMTICFTIILIMVVTLTFLIFRIVSASILQKTVRDYLLSSVRENVDKISFLTDRERQEEPDKDNVFLRYRDGWLEIDDDFLDNINDVESALYTDEGNMLYGRNPIARSMEGEDFTASRVYRHTEKDGSRYFIYDRKMTGKGLEDLWIRGVVPLTLEEIQLSGILRTTAIFVPVLLFIGIMVSWFSIRQSLQPVHRIEQTAAEISKGTDLERRIEIGDVDLELYDLAQAFNGMLDRLKHAFEAEQQFTSDASHELRTPTAVILAQTELMLEKDRSEEEYRSGLRVIRRQGRRMRSLISAMLDYSRLELRPENYPLEELDLSGLTQECADDISMIYQDRISVRTEIDPGIRIDGNQMLVERAIQNVLVNACKYGHENGNVTVRLTAVNRDPAVDRSTEKELSLPEKIAAGHGLTENAADTHSLEAVCQIIDDGPGIPEADQPYIFDRFYRADPSRSSGSSGNGVPGAGLGLSLARKIMEIHGGSIDVRSEVGKGSTFSLHFPILQG